jgi:hypothetical protein
MVGHTHEDIDQMFSVLAWYLKNHAAPTFPAFCEAVEKALNKKLREDHIRRTVRVVDSDDNTLNYTCEGVQEVHAFSDWLLPHVDPQ